MTHRVLLLIVLALTQNIATAQSIDVDKSTGLIKVDDHEAFYLKGVNKVLWQKDYQLTNLDGEELAYLKAEHGQAYNNASHQYQDETYYGVTFSKSGNYCELHGYTSLSIIKSLARTIASARLIQNGQVSAEAEQKFIVMHNGTFLKDPNRAPLVVNVNTDQPKSNAGAPSAGPADISLQGDKIYNHDELVGSFRLVQDNIGKTIVTIYNKGDAQIALARYSGQIGDDWSVSLGINTETVTLRYHEDEPLLKLFKALADKGYLQY